MSRIGSDIYRLRTEKGLTQKQLGKMVGVAEGFIIDVEAGRKVIGDNLLTRVYKALGQEFDNQNIYADAEKDVDTVKDRKVLKPVQGKAAQKPVIEMWSDALDSILKTVPVYDYKLDKAVETKKLPVIDNKVEGYAKDKIFYIKIEDDDMSGFRITKGDLALAYSTHEIERDSFFLVEHNGQRLIRQIKKLDGDKILLVGNKGSLITETVSLKTIKVLAKLIRLEIVL